MSKARTVFSCQNCGTQSPKWLGRCPECKAWNSFVEETYEQQIPAKQNLLVKNISGSEDAMSISEVDLDEESRLKTGLSEFDRVSGGGLVLGSVLLIGGDPGVGKSTMVLQVLNRLAEQKIKVLYVTGEESIRQVRLRAERLKTLDSMLVVAAQNDTAVIKKMVKKEKPQVLVVDSIQTMYTAEISSAPGSVSQVRESAMRIASLSKRLEMTSLLIGHVTKDGSLAGPRVLEHMVDCVLTFEGERGYPFRVLRATKNRFGSTNEVGVFEMTREGLVEVDNPSQLFLAERPTDEPGSVVTVSIEGTRPLLVEVQALVSPSGYGTPRRTCIGVDPNRVALLAAVLEKKAGLDLVGCDIFVNVAGGVRLNEPAVDLGIACALASSLVDRPIGKETLVFGEIGLAGELRSVSQPELRLKEAEKMGFTHAIMPLVSGSQLPKNKIIKAKGVKNISQAIDMLF